MEIDLKMTVEDAVQDIVEIFQPYNLTEAIDIAYIEILIKQLINQAVREEKSKQ